MLFDYREVQAWTADILVGIGMPEEDAIGAAGIVARSEVRGYWSHSFNFFPPYVERMESGEMKAAPAMTNRSFPGGIVLNVDSGMGQVAGLRAIELGIKALEAQASVLVTLQNCGHLGAMGIYALIAAEKGAMCILGQAGPPCVAMEGFVGAAIGTNPLGFGCPLPGQAPIVFDISSSVVARGKVHVAMREGKQLPQGWAVDSQGRPTTDPETAMLGAMLPAGGYKGMCLAMLVQCLSGVLGGSEATLNTVPTMTGATGDQTAFFLFIKPEAFVDPALFAQLMHSWTSQYTSRSSEARLPGSRGAELEAQCLKEGLTLDGPVLAGLQKLGERKRRPFPAPLKAAI